MLRDQVARLREVENALIKDRDALGVELKMLENQLKDQVLKLEGVSS